MPRREQLESDSNTASSWTFFKAHHGIQSRERHLAWFEETSRRSRQIADMSALPRERTNSCWVVMLRRPRRVRDDHVLIGSAVVLDDVDGALEEHDQV